MFSAFTVFAVGYLLAPLGALLFGFIGDHFGRKKALTISILAMAIATAMIGLVPSYNAIGIAAPILITLFRLIQGFVASAEYVGSAVFLVEHAKPHKKALYGCLTSSAYSLGFILAGLVTSFCTQAFMPDWAWRLGFGFSLIAGILIFYLRKQVTETPEYQNIDNLNKPKQPFLYALKQEPLAVLGVMGISWLVSIMTFGTYVFLATYLHTYFNLHLILTTLLITFALAVDSILEPFVAILADRVGYVKVFSFGITSLLVLSIPIFSLISSGSILSIAFGLICMSVIIAISYAPLNAYMVSLFPSECRYSGFGVSFNIGISVFGGTTPLVMLWLVNKTGNYMSPAWYYMFGAIIGLLSLLVCEYSRKRLMNKQPGLVFNY